MYSHNEINSDIRFLAKSEIRLKILSELYDCPDNVRGLVKRTAITYSSVSSNITKLEENNFIRKVRNKYYINPSHIRFLCSQTRNTIQKHCNKGYQIKIYFFHYI